MIRTVLFDLDGTLVDDGQSWRSSVAAAIAVVCRGVDTPSAEDVSERYFQVAGEVWEEIYDRLAALIHEHATTLISVRSLSWNRASRSQRPPI